MKWFLNTSTDKTMELDVELTDMIGDVKIKIQVQEGIPVKQQSFVCAGNLLEDSLVLSDIDLDVAKLLLTLSAVTMSIDNFQ